MKGVEPTSAQQIANKEMHHFQADVHVGCANQLFGLDRRKLLHHHKLILHCGFC
jgi:hypothetical protein